MGRASRKGGAGTAGTALRGSPEPRTDSSEHRIISGDKIYNQYGGGYNYESEDFQNLEALYSDVSHDLPERWQEVLERGGMVTAGSGHAGVMLEPSLEGEYGPRARFYGGPVHRSLRPDQAVVAFAESENAEDFQALLRGAEDYARSAGKRELLLEEDPLDAPLRVQELLRNGWRSHAIVEDSRHPDCQRMVFRKDLSEEEGPGESLGLRSIGKKSSWKQGEFHIFNNDRLKDADPAQPLSFTLRVSDEENSWQGRGAFTPSGHLQFFQEALAQGRSLEAVEVGTEPGGNLPVATWTFSDVSNGPSDTFSEGVRLDGTMYEALVPDRIAHAGHEDLRELHYNAISKASALERAREDSFQKGSDSNLRPLFEEVQGSWDAYARELSLRMPHLPLDQEELDRMSRGLEATRDYLSAFRRSL